MLSQATSGELASLLMKLSQGEKEIEILRQLLCEKIDFDPYTVFSTLDRYRSSFLTPKDFKEFLTKHGVPVGDNELFLLVRQYDSDNDSKITLDDFFQFCLPSTDLNLRSRTLARASRRLSYDVEYSFLRLLEREASLHKEIEERRRQLAAKDDFTVLSCFQKIAGNSSYIEESQIVEFLRSHGHYVMVEDIDALLRRVDTDGDMMLNYTEFLEALLTITTVFTKYEDKKEKSNTSSPAKSESTKKEEAVKNEDLLDLDQALKLSDIEDDPVHRPSTDTQQMPEPSLEQFITPKKPGTPVDELDLVTPEHKETRIPKREMTFNPDIKKELSYSEIPAHDFSSLAFLYLHILKIEKQREIVLQELAQKLDFNPKAIFDEAAVEETVMSEDMSAWLKRYKEEDLEEINFEILHKDFATGMPLQGFLEFLLPRDQEYTESLFTRFEEEQKISLETVELLYSTLKVIESYHAGLEEEKKILSGLPLEGIFEAIDQDKDGYISKEELSYFLGTQGIWLNSNDLELLLRKLDKEGKGAISQQDFQEQVLSR